MKKSRKSSNKSPRNDSFPQVQEIAEQYQPNNINIKKIIWGAIGGVLIAIIFVAIGWFFGHQALVNGH